MTQTRNMATVGAVVPAAALVAVPWANGGGVTRVIADRADLRLSLATIAQAGPFSRFPGVTRHFALVAGQVVFGPHGLVLDAGCDPVVFSGADAVDATPLGGPVLAFNLMVPDGAPCVRLERFHGRDMVNALAIFACEAITVDGLTVAAHDTVFPTGPVRLSGPALVVR